MRFSLIICTYMRPQPLLKLLQSVSSQTLYPNEILIIDGSLYNQTQNTLEENNFKGLKYFKVQEEDRGLTRQRNYGIERVSELSDIVCFLDDDVFLEPDYFDQLITTYSEKPDALAVGGYITNEVSWDLSDKKNNTILLSPAAASFDQFLNFEKRGDELILSTITLDLLYAAVPHEPTLGPITTPLIISQYCLGRLATAQ